MHLSIGQNLDYITSGRVKVDLIIMLNRELDKYFTLP